MRSSESDQVKRVNAAMALLRRHPRRAEVASSLMRRFRISRRQAYRYVQKAEKAEKPMQIPERKVVFTVKLPKGLAESIRRLADSSGQTLSGVVAQALEAFLRSGRWHGRKQPTKTG